MLSFVDAIVCRIISEKDTTYREYSHHHVINPSGKKEVIDKVLFHSSRYFRNIASVLDRSDMIWIGWTAEVPFPWLRSQDGVYLLPFVNGPSAIVPDTSAYVLGKNQSTECSHDGGELTYEGTNQW